MGGQLLSQLPSPPPEATDWSWVKNQDKSYALPGNYNWPRITVVTPSFNQAQYIEETIRSILLQDYPNLEYIVIDGGSSDNSVEIIKKYESRLAYWVSEPDQGQAHAINKGFARATGSLLGWINSDDLLLPESLFKLAQAYKLHPKKILLGDLINHKEQLGTYELARQSDVTFESIVEPWRNQSHWQQPGTFFPSTVFQRVGPLDESLRYVFDWDWMLRALQSTEVHYLRQPVALFRFHAESKTVGEASNWSTEEQVILGRYWPLLPNLNSAASKAAYEVYRAKPLFSLRNLDRRRGWRHLQSAVSYHWPVIFSRNFIELVTRSITPLIVLKLFRYAHHTILRCTKKSAVL